MNIDYLFRNYPENSESIEYSEYKIMKGGVKAGEPDGGFPPIYICGKIEEENGEEGEKKREYKTHKESISIKELMESRRKQKMLEKKII